MGVNSHHIDIETEEIQYLSNEQNIDALIKKEQIELNKTKEQYKNIIQKFLKNF